MDVETFRWLVTAIVTGAILPLVGLCWKLRSQLSEVKEAMGAELSEVKVRLAIAETKLLAFGASAPQLNDAIEDLTIRFDALMRDGVPEEHARRSDWPTPRATPATRRRRERP